MLQLFSSSRRRPILRCIVPVLALLGWGAGCSVPRVIEDGPAACANDEDEDEDGLYDCDDPECAGSGVCETDPQSCADGLDEDRDGRIDCEQESCVRGGFCAITEADCDVVHRTGCTRGQSCQALDSVSGEQRVCVQPGIREENQGCEATADDPAGGCRDGTICYGNGLCSRPCLEHDDCPRSATCIRAPTLAYGICTLTCYPGAGCIDGYSCIPLQWGGIAYESKGWMHTCVSTGVVSGMVPEAEAQVGEPCIDAVLAGTPPARVCRSGLVCVPAVGETEGTCREVCLAAADGSDTSSCATGRCVAIDPYDQRAPRPADFYRFGICR